MGEDDANKNRVEAKNGLENYCYSMQNSIMSGDMKDRIPSDKKKELEDMIKETIDWLDANQTAEKEEYEEKRKELESMALPILQSMGGEGGGMKGMGGMGSGAGDEGAGGPTIEEID